MAAREIDDLQRLIALMDEMIRLAAADGSLPNTESILRMARECIDAEKARGRRSEHLN
ncbi:hypothetical protein [Stappia sp.]|uniref:hypothetical protein n=1 Tax=Stappia sp. TaxID=1870903 RepID=UPI0032D92347